MGLSPLVCRLPKRLVLQDHLIKHKQKKDMDKACLHGPFQPHATEKSLRDGVCLKLRQPIIKLLQFI